MKSILKYENIYFRNIFLLLFLYTTIFSEHYFYNLTQAGENPVYVMKFHELILLYVIIFVNNYFIVRPYLVKNKVKIFLGFEVLYIFVSTIIYYYYVSFQIQNILFILALIEIIINFMVGIGFYFFHIWFMGNVINTKKKLIQKDMELSFLKQQLNPHFLLNAMNNLYGVSLTEPAIISDKILELSDLLRYQIESVKTDEVAIRDEITFAKNYLDYVAYKSNNLHMENKIYGNIQSMTVPPLLFLPLIENAAKYAMQTYNPFIKLFWKFEASFVIFSIENNYSKNNLVAGTQIGLSNLQRRLEILDAKSELIIQQEETFKVTLKVWQKNTNA